MRLIKIARFFNLYWIYAPKMSSPLFPTLGNKMTLASPLGEEKAALVQLTQKGITVIRI